MKSDKNDEENQHKHKHKHKLTHIIQIHLICPTANYEGIP